MKELPSAAAVARWKEAVLGLSDKRFFDLMRLYLGPVKTPFNKQRLTDALAAFLRRPAVRENILAGLDTLDLRLISAVRFLHEPDRTRLTDYENAVSGETRAFLKVHTSNYRIVGFTCSVSLGELCKLGRARKIPVIQDLGSGVVSGHGKKLVSDLHTGKGASPQDAAYHRQKGYLRRPCYSSFLLRIFFHVSLL